MRPLCPVQISGVGSYLPEQRLTNHDLERTLDTSDEWILQRTGISERRVLESGRATSDMAVEAIRSLCDSTSLDPSDIDLLIDLESTSRFNKVLYEFNVINVKPRLFSK